MTGYCHLHLHTQYSLNDGMIKPKPLAKRAKELGMKKIAVTEHGELMNMPVNYLALKDEGVELIVGMETYVAPRSRLDKEKAKGDMANYHLVLLCENNEGYQNLIKIASDAAINGFYNKPRTDKDTLRRYHKGLIASSACLGGSINKALLEGRYDDAKEEVLEYVDIFGEGNFFLEIQRHGLPEQDKINPLIIQLGKETGVGLIATNDCHYLYKEDWKAHDILMAHQAKTTLNNPNRKIYGSHEFYVKSPEEMTHLFRDLPEAIENTAKIAERCHVELEFGVNKIPPFDIPKSFKGTNREFLEKIVFESLERIYPTPLSKEVVDRANYEINVIDNMGYVNYFLITWDFFRFCNTGAYEIEESGPDDWVPILTGPGRGCFTPETPVYMNDGDVKNIEDVRVGDTVVGADGAHKVHSVFEYDVNEKITDIHISGSHIQVTNDHKILALVTGECRNTSYREHYCKNTCQIYERCAHRIKQELKWVPASNLKKGDFLCIPRDLTNDDSSEFLDLSKHIDDKTVHFDDKIIYTINPLTGSIVNKVNRFLPIDDELGFVIGALIGNGWTTHRSAPNASSSYSVGFAFNPKQSWMEDRIRKYFNDVVGYSGAFETTTRPNAKGTCSQINFYSKALSLAISKLIGKGAKNKQIPIDLINNPRCWKGLIMGLFNTDGNIPELKNSKLTYSTVSRKLHHQLRILLMNIGIVGNTVERKRNPKKHWMMELKISVSGKQMIDLYDVLNKEPPSRKAGKNESLLEDHKYIYKRIYNVSSLMHSGKVYDLGVEDNPSYNVAGYVVHNSGAGSIVARSLEITKIDPLKYDLLFERFLDPSRVSMPDIDSDFHSNRRQEVIDYVVYKYGRDSIAQIITFGTLAARAVIRAVGRVLDYPYATYDKVAKMIPQEIGITIKKALEVNQEFFDLYNSDKSIKELIDYAVKLEGLPTSCGTHAAGVLITDKQGVSAHVPLWKTDKGIVAQYDKDLLESLGLLKMDFLGLNTLVVLDQARIFVEKNFGVKIDFEELYKIPTLEPLKLIRDGNTAGIFQLESAGMTGFMKDLQPHDLEDIIAGISMYRPGPMNEIPHFLFNKRNPHLIQYPVDGKTKDILGPTYGILCYQEQCMRAVVDLAGYDRSDSDGFRKVIAKKIASKMPLHKKWFIDGRQEKDYDEYGKLRDFRPIAGGVAMGHSRESLESFWDTMIDFAKYAFNKSHAAAYAVVAYLTCWFAYYYPTEFMAALLNSVAGVHSKTARYIDYSKRVFGIEILPPDINQSSKEFIPLPDKKILFTLSTKGSTSACLEGIQRERDEHGPYKHLLDFLVRTRSFLDKSTYEGLIGCGAFKSFGIIKSQHLAALEDFWDGAYKKTKDAEKRALSKGKMYDFKGELIKKLDGILPQISEFPREIELRLEKRLIGIYLSDNPLYKYAYTIKTKSNFCTSDVEYDIDETTGAIIMSNSNVRDGQKILFVGMLNEVVEITTKAKKLMCRLEMEDLTGTASAVVWPQQYTSLKNDLIPDCAYMFEGYLKIEDGETPTIVIDRATLMENVVTERAIIEVDNMYEAKEVIDFISNTRMAKGMTPIYILHQGKKILLTKNYWVNLPCMADKYPELKIQTW